MTCKECRWKFDRILTNLSADPGSAVTASCALLEALFKAYINDEGLELPNDKSVGGLWKTVRTYFKLDPKDVKDENLQKVLRGLESIIQGIGGLRTNGGSAHGQDVRTGYRIEARHARLVSQSAFVLAIFFVETADARKAKERRRR